MNNSGIEVDGDEISTTNGSTDMGNGLVGIKNSGIYINDVDNINEELEQNWKKNANRAKGWLSKGME